MVDVPVMRACRVSGAAVEKTLALPQLQLGLFLRPFVFGSHLCGVRPWSTGLWTFLGENSQICRIQRFLVQQWIHVYVSLRRRVSCWLRCTSRCVPLRFADEGKTHHQLLTVP